MTTKIELQKPFRTVIEVLSGKVKTLVNDSLSNKTSIEFVTEAQNVSLSTKTRTQLELVTRQQKTALITEAKSNTQIEAQFLSKTEIAPAVLANYELRRLTDVSINSNDLPNLNNTFLKYDRSLDKFVLEAIQTGAPVFIQDTQPSVNGPYIWVQTNVNGVSGDYTIFFEDGIN